MMKLPSLSSISDETNEEPPGSGRGVPIRAIRELSDRLLSVQRSLRILDALRWPIEAEQAFFAAGCRELPPIGQATYASKPLPIVPGRMRDILRFLHKDITCQLGTHPAGIILARLCAETLSVVDLLEARGTPEFGSISRRLFGSTTTPGSGGMNLVDLACRLADGVASLEQDADLGQEERPLSALAAADILAERLQNHFRCGPPVQVEVSPAVTADAAAGGNCLRLRAGSQFSLREVRLLEVHEGWVHLGTTRNAGRQPVCTFLTRATPSATTTQEGLAVLTELLAFASHPARLRRLTNRVEGIALAENGADFLDVFHFFRERGAERAESYQQTMRIFRGSLPSGAGPFTKDLSYIRGFLEVVHFLRQAFRSGRARRAMLLFCGKTSLEDMPQLQALADEGLLLPPAEVPPPFGDLRALGAWLCCAGWLGS